MTNFTNSSEKIYPVTLWDSPINHTDIIYCNKEVELIHTILSTSDVNAVFEFQEQFRHQLSLYDYNCIISLLRELSKQ